jgi:hypothetical protein
MPSDRCEVPRKDRLLKSWPELQMRVLQLGREWSPPPGLRLPQAELSRKSNQVARGRIRQFESDMPSQAVVSNSGGCRLGFDRWLKANAVMASIFWAEQPMAV